jgi:antitoxin CptB
MSPRATSLDPGPAPFDYGKTAFMGDETETSDDLAMRRRRLKFRCWHRGTKETDLLLGRFADAHVDGLDADGIAEFEALLETPDPVIFAWIVGGEPVPEDIRTPLVDRLIAFYAA